MAIATASLDFDPSSRSVKLSSVTPELTALAAHDLFAGMAPPALRVLAGHCAIRQHPRGAVIAAEGSVPTSAFLVVSGRVRAVRRAESGREIIVEIFRSGDLLADTLIAREQPLPNAWEALEATTLLSIPRDVLLADLQRMPELPMVLCRQLVQRLGRSQELAVGLVLSDVEGRVVTALLALGRQDGQVATEGLLIRQRPTQQELANSIGACRETVSRIISNLTRRGLVTPRGRGLLVSNRLVDGAP